MPFVGEVPLVLDVPATLPEGRELLHHPPLTPILEPPVVIEEGNAPNPDQWHAVGQDPLDHHLRRDFRFFVPGDGVLIDEPPPVVRVNGRHEVEQYVVEFLQPQLPFLRENP